MKKLIREFLRKHIIPVNQNEFRALRFRNRYKDRRCFIIGNGPSLRVDDLEELHSKNELTFASNKIFRIFDSTLWRPSFYAIVDPGVAKAEAKNIETLVQSHIFSASYLKTLFLNRSDIIYFRSMTRLQAFKDTKAPNLFVEIPCGGTVAYTMIQLATWMGFNELILLGVDFDYKLNNLVPSPDFPGLQSYTPDNTKNYFASDYIKDGESVIAPDLSRIGETYKHLAYLASKDLCPRIINATRGGKLDFFPRGAFEGLFQ